MEKSLNGFAFSGSVTNTGQEVTLVAHKNDHEGEILQGFKFGPTGLTELINLLEVLRETSKARRKAIRKAAKKAPGTEVPGDEPVPRPPA